MATRDIVFKIKSESDGKAVQEMQAIGKAAKESGDLTKKAMAEVASATKVAEKAAEELAKAQAAKGQQLTEGFKKMGEGLVGLGRSIGLAGVATSENMESAIKLFARFESGVQLFKGLADSVEGARKIWSVYTAASKAAAAADTAAAAAAMLRSRASAGAGVASAGAGLVSGGASAAGGVAAGAGAAGGLAAVAAAAAPLVIALVAVAAVLAVVSAIFPSFGKALWNLVTGTNEVAEAQKKAADRTKQGIENHEENQKRVAAMHRDNDAIQNFQSEQDVLNGQAAGKSPAELAQERLARAKADYANKQAAFDQAEERKKYVEEQYAAAGTVRAGTADGGWFGASQKDLDAKAKADAQARQAGLTTSLLDAKGESATNAERLGSSRNELKEAIKAAAEEEARAKQAQAQKDLKSDQEKTANAEKQLKASQDRVKAEEDGLKAVRDKAKAEQDRLKSAQEKFVDMDPLQRKALVAARQKADAGGELDKRERDLLRGDGLNQDAIDADTAAKVKKLSPEEMGYFAQQQKNVNNADADVKAKESSFAAAKAKEKDLQAAVDSLTATAEKSEAAMKEAEELVARVPQAAAQAIKTFVYQTTDGVKRELEAKSSYENDKAASGRKAAANGGAK